MFCNVKFRREFVDLLEVEGKFESVIEDEDESLVWEKLLKPFELITAFIKIKGTLKTIVSEKENGLAILKESKPLKDVWTIVLLAD